MEHVVRIMRQKEDVATREGQRTKTGRGRAASGRKKRVIFPLEMAMQFMQVRGRGRNGERSGRQAPGRGGRKRWCEAMTRKSHTTIIIKGRAECLRSTAVGSEMEGHRWGGGQ